MKQTSIVPRALFLLFEHEVDEVGSCSSFEQKKVSLRINRLFQVLNKNNQRTDAYFYENNSFRNVKRVNG